MMNNIFSAFSVFILTVFVMLFGSAAFAQSLPAAGPMMTQSAPSAGAPGTNAPADAAPVGAAISDWMSHEPALSTNNGSSTTSFASVLADAVNSFHYGTDFDSSLSGKQIDAESQVRQLGTNVRRDIVVARAKGANVGAAERDQWLGNISLVKGHRNRASGYFRQAEEALRTPTTSATNVNAYGISQSPAASDMNSDNRAIAAY